MIKEEYKYSELTSRIIRCAMTAHSALGNGFQACLPEGSSACRQEVIYQRTLEIEMALSGIDFKRKYEMSIFYRNEQIGTRTRFIDELKSQLILTVSGCSALTFQPAQ
jgi:GxxExxY protein